MRGCRNRRAIRIRSHGLSPNGDAIHGLSGSTQATATTAAVTCWNSVFFCIGSSMQRLEVGTTYIIRCICRRYQSIQSIAPGRTRLQDIVHVLSTCRLVRVLACVRVAAHENRLLDRFVAEEFESFLFWQAVQRRMPFLGCRAVWNKTATSTPSCGARGSHAVTQLRSHHRLLVLAASSTPSSRLRVAT